MYRGVINGKAGKAAALPKFSDTLTLSQSRGQIMPRGIYLHPRRGAQRGNLKGNSVDP